MKRAAVVLTALLCLAGSLAGCSSTMMQGTPFYRGPKPEGKASDRVNLWPIVYYQHPVLSVLWPLGQFDSAAHRNRFFPAFWGSPEGKPPYFYVPPLVWYEKGDVAGLFPLFLWFSRPGGSSVHILWPLVNWKSGHGETGWRVWPLYGQYSDQRESLRYALWPLVVFMRDGEEVVRWALPFYAGARGPGGAWDVFLPLFFRQKSDAGRRLALFPFLYDSRDAAGNRTLLTPLYMMGRNGPSLWDLFVPLYFRYQGPESRTTVVLPAYFSSQSGSVAQRLLFPLFYTWTDGESSLLLTLPYGLSKSGQTRTAYAFPLLSALTTSPQGKELWALFPLSHWRWQDGLQQAHVLPAFYWDRASDTFLSLPYARWRDGTTRYTSVLGPLYVGVKGEDSRSTSVLWPLTSFWQDTTGTGSYALPFYIYSHRGESKWLNLGLVLAHFNWDPAGSRFWLLAGLAGRMGEQDRSRSHLWPLYRYQRNGDDVRFDFGPFLPLSFDKNDPQFSLSLAAYSRVGDVVSHHFFPFWYSRTTEDSRHLNIGVLLANYARSRDRSSLSLLWPVFKRWTRKNESGLRVWPAYSYRREGDTSHLTLGPSLGEASLIGATWNEDYNHKWLFPLFLKSGQDTASWVQDGKGREMDTREHSFTLFPLVWQHSSTPLPGTARIIGEESHADMPPPRPHGYFSILPLFGRGYDGDMEAPTGPAESNFWLLGWLYDSKKQLRPTAADPQKRDVYARRRILWRVMNYERVNDSTSLDVFPGITYDKTPGKRKVVSFLWHVFRYEWDKDKGTRVHVLFIPFGGGKGGEEQTEPRPSEE